MILTLIAIWFGLGFIGFLIMLKAYEKFFGRPPNLEEGLRYSLAFLGGPFAILVGIFCHCVFYFDKLKQKKSIKKLLKTPLWK